MATKVRMRGMNRMISNIRKITKNIDGNAEAGIMAAGLHLKRLSMMEVPVMTGNLRSTCYVTGSNGKISSERPGDEVSMNHEKVLAESSREVIARMTPTSIVGYSAVYALSVHENPRSGRTGGVTPGGAQLNPGFTDSGMPSTRVTHAQTGKWKFLEDPLKNNFRDFLKIIRDKSRMRR